MRANLFAAYLIIFALVVPAQSFGADRPRIGAGGKFTGDDVRDVSFLLWDKPLAKPEWVSYSASSAPNTHQYDSANVRGPVISIFAVRTKHTDPGSETTDLIYWLFSCRELTFYGTDFGKIDANNKVKDLKPRNPILRASAVYSLARVGPDANLFIAVCGEPSQDDISNYLSGLPVKYPFESNNQKNKTAGPAH